MKKVFIYQDRDTVINYANAFEGAGLEAVCSFNIDDSEGCDALLVSGGGDVNPALYGEENTKSMGINDERDAAEMALIKKFHDAKKPILGICRGHQIINVYFGGKLIQNIDNVPKHSSGTIEYDAAHLTIPVEGGFLAKLYGNEPFPTNSSHHQAVTNVPEMFKIVAWSEDNLVEAYECPEEKIYCTQFHPERMCLAKRREDTVDGIKIFKFFAEIVNAE